MKIAIRKMIHLLDEVPGETQDRLPLRRLAIVAVVGNPYAGQRVEDLSELVTASVDLGQKMADSARQIFGDHKVECYGKAGLVGLAGEQEHANALLTTAFAQPFRTTFGGRAWISSVTKIASPGEALDVPMNSTENVYVRSHYGTMTVCLPGTPLPHEIALIFAIGNRGRISARVGGMTQMEAQQA